MGRTLARAHSYLPVIGSSLRWLRTLAAVSLVSMRLSADPVPPAIDPRSVVNGASRMPPSLAGGALARGGRFSLTGVRLGPARGVEGNQADPPVKLEGVSVHIAQGQTDVAAGMLFVSAERIEGLIPSSAPLGPVRLTVVCDGLASEPYSLTLVDSSFGFFTAETAPAALPEARRPIQAAPGETVTLWGAGLGDAAPQILVGGKSAGAVHTREESCCKGVDRIEFRIPADAPQGCYVPVQASAAGRPSNVIGIAIHPVGQVCQDQVGWFRDAVQHAAQAGLVVLARISLDAPASAGSKGGYQFDYAAASFGKQPSGGLLLLPSLPPIGACTVITRRVNLGQMLAEARAPESKGLDAGASISVVGPGGRRLLGGDARRPDFYRALLGGELPFGHVPRTPLYLRPGVYTLTSPGGRDVGPFTARVETQRPIRWKNRDRLPEVRRAAGVTVEWKEASQENAVLIAAASSDRVTGDSALCLCMAYAKDRRFTIPPISLDNLPPTADDAPEPSFLLLSELPIAPPARIQARGLGSDGTAAFAAFLSVTARFVRFR